MHDSFTFTDVAGVALAAHRWSPPTRPLAAVELVHGMGEHIGRYQHVVDALNDAGFVVYGYDQRGHGASTGALEPGYVGASGWPSLVSDIGEFAQHVREREDGLPLGLVAHSMGSFASQQALLRDSELFDAIALTGTAALDLLEPALDLDTPLDLAMFNAGFAPPRTDYDWLSRDDSIVDAYVADPLCGFGLDVEGTRAMFLGARALSDPAALASVRKDLPIYLAVGDKDPVNAGLALFEPLVARFRDTGFTDVTATVYPDGRHEVLNETNRIEVIGELVAWLRARIGQPG
ncbi:alpha/beta fold hydrolase [Gordonia westfalica]|uniref:Lysophospholipase, alpha-beta hydrolase superfamily n=1 Tax=Gordonia westfalica TaxID=158898 RepID=A0A1H2LFJ1_9ACTN|nr:alpha/beta hydrolase [Gordonia westfalica]SDU79679.1 Lysophospholipase, alpha-beta hydrolase superfamily [Gordonia westfalica]